jgi:hypothetical protein
LDTSALPHIDANAQAAAEAFIGAWVWVAVVLFLVLLFRNFIQNVVEGISIQWGNEYEQDEVVWLHLNGDRRPARIARFGLARTSFYCYDVVEKDGEMIITGGTLLTVPNSEVKGLRIERPLDKLDLLPPAPPKGDA